ncbi:MAG: hypothetical protein H6555_07070 [Lewinellaceae bacterium]|nr:hypothetical protein [Lewinellaceae bacterium]
MLKSQQLRHFQASGLPTPPFRIITYTAFRTGNYAMEGLRFPVAVRSSYHDEDGETSSQAGQFLTRLQVSAEALPEALAEVFASYPQPEGSSLIVQEMVPAEYSGVLFAYRRGIWKVEWTAGLGDQLVSGQITPELLLLPRFSMADYRWSKGYSFWAGPSAALRRPFIKLSALAGKLLGGLPASHGLDIEWAVAQGELYLLQARPITTRQEEEELLTTANHREILPPVPSRLMTGVIADAGPALFSYYRRLDTTLPERSFIWQTAGMPWINLSALLDVMVHWGLPTGLVSESVGAVDPYQVKPRFWAMLPKWRVFLAILGQQLTSVGKSRRWVAGHQRQLPGRIAARREWWLKDPRKALTAWQDDFQQVYVGLVEQMQSLTGAMAGPVRWLNQRGWLAPLAKALQQKSISTTYLEAIADLGKGRMDRAQFLAQYGHRGFYESDLAQPRFQEWTADAWAALGGKGDSGEKTTPESAGSGAWWTGLFAPIIRLVHARENLRHETMHLFADFRREWLQYVPALLPENTNPWAWTPAEVREYLTSGKIPVMTDADKPVGWDMDTFRANRDGRRIPMGPAAAGDNTGNQQGIGLVPGKVTGQVWRVAAATSLDLAQKPGYDVIILVADALDPGWAPFFSQVDAVVSYVGGLLSHASIILREAGIPAITQLPRTVVLRTGDWVSLDGRTGEIEVLPEKPEKKTD